jgi:hypothetical protein
MKYSTIKNFEDTGLVRTICTQKSEDPYDGIWKYGEEGALANYEELARFFGITTGDIVHVKQTHTASVRIVTKKDGGEEILRPESVSGFDGMITNEKQLLLCTLQADCVPVFLLDPAKKVIGMIHSGWKGTANQISVNAVRRMKDAFGCEPSDILAAMGPCNCGDCYEVGEDLLEPFSIYYSPAERNTFFRPLEKEGKYLLDLPEAISIALRREGVKEKNITKPFACTYHEDAFASYRKDKDPTARMLTGIMLL